MINTKKDIMLLKTPQRSGLLWREEADGSVTVVIPFGTARFRVMQAILYEMSLTEGELQDFSTIKPQLIKLRGAGAEVWKQMNGYCTVQEITANICKAANYSYASTINEVIRFCKEAHRLGIVNIDYPQPPEEGYVQALLIDLEQKPYISVFKRPRFKASVIKAITTFGQTIGDEYYG